MPRSTRIKREKEEPVAIKEESVQNKRIKLENDGTIDHTEIKEEKFIKRKIEHIEVEIKEEDLKPPNVFPFVQNEDISVDSPKSWADIYNEVVRMRSKIITPVDTQGCERMPNTINPGIKLLNPRIYRFQLLISLMLSSQTKDEVNFGAMTKLHQGMLARGHKDGLSLEATLTLSEQEIDSYICKVGFHNRKSQYIKQACLILQEKFDGDIPKTIADIVILPGVGPKMGYLLLQNGWGINDGIGVDVHLHRLAQMWGWCSKSSKPEQTRVELEKWLPKKFWADINPLLVGFGQAVCIPRASNCDVCTLSKNKLCKHANKKLKLPIPEDRLLKLGKQRADLSQLIKDSFL